MSITGYRHSSRTVYGYEQHRGRHHDYDICQQCSRHFPADLMECRVKAVLMAVARLIGLRVVVWECPLWKDRVMS